MIKSRRIFGRMTLIAGCLLLTIATVYSLRSAQAIGTWSGAVALTPTDRGAIFPEIAVDSTGVIHVVYVETSTDLNGSRTISYKNNKSGTFSAPRSLSSPFTFVGDPSISLITIGGTVRVHVAYTARQDAGSNLTTRVYHAVSNDGGTNWAAGTTVAPNLVGFSPSVHVDQTGVAHIVFGGYEGLNNGQPIINIFYSTNPSGSWSAPQKIASREDGNSYNSFPAITTTYVNNVLTVHVFYMGQVHNAGEFGKWVYSMRKVGAGGWSVPAVRGTTAANFPKLVAVGSAVYATWQGSVGATTDIEPFYSVSADNGSTWSAPVSRGTNTSAQGSRPDIARAANNSVMIVWDEGFQTSDNKTDIWANYSPNGAAWASATPVYKAPGFSLESDVAGSCDEFHAVWHDSVSGPYRIFFSQTGLACGTTILPTPTPVPPTATPIPPVNFTLTRTSVSPTTTPNINASLANFEGSPNEMRYSPTPFAANDTTVGWIGLQAAITVNTSSAVANCGVTIYAQVRNTNTGQVSTVKSVSAVVDTAVQSQAMIYTMEHAPQPRPAGTKAPNEQDFAPDGVDPNYTRSMTFVYRIPQEPVPCVGIKSYKVESFVRSPSPFPNLEEGIAPFQPFSTGLDVGGIGSPEQTVTANVVLTDTLNNQAAFAKTVFYDDDPPILANGGSISFTNGLTSAISVVPITFDADVTDDGYTNAAPANQKYWGVWVVATANATMPTPAVFAQYGRVHYVAPGSEQVDYISLTNDSALALREPGTRFVHIRFLDGAGNYSEQGITSPQITLSNPFQEGLRTYLPVIAR